MVAACGTWVFGCGILLAISRNPDTQNLQLHTRPTTGKPTTHVPQTATTYIILELLMMGIMVPKTC